MSLMLVIFLISITTVVATEEGIENDGDLRTFNISCQNLSLVQEGGDFGIGCKECHECFTNMYNYCIRDINETIGCACMSFVPKECQIGKDADLTHKMEYNLSVKYKDKLKAPIYDARNSSGIVIELPKLVDNRLKFFEIESANISMKFLGECPKEIENSTHCSFSKSVNLRSFKSSSEFKEIIEKEKIPSNIDQINVSYSIRFNYSRQVDLGREESKETIRLHSFDTTIFSDQITINVTKDHVEPVRHHGSGSLLTILLILILVCLAVFVVCQLRRRRMWPFNKSNTKSFEYRYSPANDVTRPVRHTVSSGEEFLDEGSPEIQEYRELLGLCPMILPFKLEVKEVIGHGKFGSIHKGSLLFDNNRSTMVHGVQSPYRMTVSEIRNFLKALEASSKAGQHENIVSVIGCCDQDQRLLMCLDYVVGPNLQILLRESRTLEHFSDFASTHHTASLMSSHRLLTLMLGVASGAAHLEAKQVIHPHFAAINVLIGDSGNPKIAGFGFAKVTDLYAREGEKRHSVARWLAPESITDEDGHCEWTLRSQIWSLAIVLWEIASLGGTPYAKIESTMELLLLIRTAVTRLEKLPYISYELYALMTRCWSGDALNRPKAHEIVTQLISMLENTEANLNLNLSDDNRFPYSLIKPSLEEITEFQKSSLGV